MSAFVTTNAKNYQHRTPLLRIKPVTRAIIIQQLRDSWISGPNIDFISHHNAFYYGLNELLRSEGLKAFESMRKHYCAANIKQVQTAASWLRTGKGSSGIQNEATLSIDHEAGHAEPVQGPVV
jgi:hypothetical protein